MKQGVPAFRERGLHLAVRDTEPQVSESINSMGRNSDTMKTYILRDLKAVEPQKSVRRSRSKPKPARRVDCDQSALAEALQRLVRRPPHFPLGSHSSMRLPS